MKELSQAQLRDYHNNGYLCIEDFAPHDLCDRLRERAVRIVTELETDKGVFSTIHQEKTSDDWFLSSGDKIRLFMEEGEENDEEMKAAPPEDNAVAKPGDGMVPESERGSTHKVNKIGHALHDLDPEFAAFSRQPRLARIVDDLGFMKPLLLQSMYIFKQPGIGGEVSVHQDSTFLYTDPLSVTGFWFALEDASISNACLWALPGGHRLNLKKRFHRDGLGGCTFTELETGELPQDGYVPLEVPKGSLVILHGKLPHKSSANRSSQTREAFTLHIVEGEAHYPSDNWLQRDSEFPARGFS